MDCDEVNQTHQTAFIDWTHRVGKYNTSGVEKLASRYKQDMACDCVEAKSGSFNMCFKVVFEDGATWVVRFPMPGKVMHPEDKIRREVAVISFIQEKTCIPTAKLVAYGMASDNHDPAMGPFIIKEWINGVSLSSIMEELPRPSWGPVLRKDIEDTALYGIYRQMSRVLLELALHDFDKIGSLSEVNHDDGGRNWCVTSRPMTLKMNEIEREGNVAMTDYHLEPFGTVTEYMEYLVRQNVDHLHQQRNSIDSADDARQKHALRRRINGAIEHFVSPEHESGPFKLFCDDLRPGNIIVDPETHKITALIDLEWMYAAPYQFLYSPPAWLILERMTMWTSDSIASYKAKFGILLRALKDEEEAWEGRGGSSTPVEQRMSTLMRCSMESGKFWYENLLRESFDFDGDLLWPNVESFLNARGSGAEIISSEEEEGEMNAFVQRKLDDLRLFNLDLQMLKSDGT